MEIEFWNSQKDLIELFRSIGQEPYAFLFYHERYPILGHRPFLTFKSKGPNIQIETPDQPTQHIFSNDPLFELKKIFSKYRRPCSKEPFFQGGLAGYFGYDLGRMLEKLSSKAFDDQGHPDISVALYDRVYLYDRLQKTGCFVAIPLPGENSDQTLHKIQSLKEALLEGKTEQRKNGREEGEIQPFVSNFTQEEYLAAIRKAKDYISQGDIYQVNLSQRFSTFYRGDPFTLFRNLILENPAPYASFFKTPELTLMSLSPERFLRIRGQEVVTCPIKGTRPRGRTPLEDSALKNELTQSAKDAAELLMIIDLERNDLGKVCEYGSIHVSELKRMEKHPTVFHLVGQVEGILRSDQGPLDCLKAMFPGGSITGAPKIRAMEIIEELEPTRRNIYTGTLGYMGFNGMSDLAILIRTLVQKGDRLSFQVGGGIVADSDPESEYLETLAKGKAFFKLTNPVYV